MTEHNPDLRPDRDHDDTQPLFGEQPHRYDDPAGQAAPPQPSQQGQPHQGAPSYSFAYPHHGQAAGTGGSGQDHQPRRARPANGFVAAVLVAALVVGGLSGLAGAAGFTLVRDLTGNANTPTSSSGPVVRSHVVQTRNSAATPGSVQQVAKSVLPSVVKINVVGQQQAGSGSGVILSSDGQILTNNHVVEVAAHGGSITVNFNDGSSAKATVVGTDPVTDLAVIKAAGVSGLTPATIGQSSNLAVGQPVVAIGSPFGLQSTVTSGIVSALNRPVSVGGTSGPSTDTTYPAIQTDAAINPGNSGGPLVNMQGQVVGIDSSIRTASDTLSSQGGSIGLGFAIPISNVWPVVGQLRSGQTPTHARMGVTVSSFATRSGLVSGAAIQSVNAGSAAQQAGLQHGDVVTKVDNQIITSSESLVATVRGFRPGDKVTVTYVRHGQQRTTTVALNSDKGSATS